MDDRGHRRRRLDLIVAAGGSALLVLCALAVRDGTVGPAEQRVFRAVNGLPDGLEPAMRAGPFLAVRPIAVGVAAVLRR